ncbi:MAG: hypothetical protein ACI87O_002078, partial [Planctomycetota bacterium]
MKIQTTWAWGLGVALMVLSAGWPAAQEPSEPEQPVVEIHLAQDRTWL